MTTMIRPTVIAAATLILGAGTLAGARAQPREESPSILIETRIEQLTSTVADALAHISAVDAGDRPVRAQGGGLAPVFIGPDLQLRLPGKLTTISAPRILALPDQPASITIGEQLTYAELTGEGDAMRLVEEPGAYEGVVIEVTPQVGASGAVHFATLDISLSEVIGRLDIATADGARTIPLPAGRPLRRTTTYSLPLTLSPGHEAAVVLAPTTTPDAPFIVRLSATVSPAAR